MGFNIVDFKKPHKSEHSAFIIMGKQNMGYWQTEGESTGRTVTGHDSVTGVTLCNTADYNNI